jgi:hypothetical protein
MVSSSPLFGGLRVAVFLVRSVAVVLKGYVRREVRARAAVNLVGGSREATPSLQNGTNRPGIPLLDQ